MILRKPYAFFIKYFRVINLIMAILMAILMYQTFVIGRFLTEYIDDYAAASDGFIMSNYINFYTFLLILLIIILTLIVTSVMFVKDKPKKLYIFNLLVYILIIILYVIDYSVISTITDRILDIRVSKALRDINYIALAIQIVSFIITLIRATGFDLKQFDFKKDLQELEIDVKDNEEFEVAIEIDKNNIHRNLRSNIRTLKYFYIENKFLINISAVIILIVIVFFIIINQIIYTANYKQNQTFSASTYSFNIKNSYLTNTNQDGVNISNKTLVVVKLDVRKFTDEKKYLNTGLVTLQVDGNSYGQTTKYNSYITDIGTPYVNENLSTDFESYVLTYEIPNNLSNKTMTLKINDNISYIRGEIGAKNIYVKLKPINLLETKLTDENKLGSTLSFSGSILGESTFTINKYELANSFKSEYNFCSKKDKCTTSYEYITPTATGSYFKTLLKLEGNFDIDETLNLDVNNVFEFLNEFGTIHYQIDDEWYEHKINSHNIKPKMTKESNITYIEVNRDILKATSIYLEFKIRNYNYKYVLK